jgi:hypothetical protein
MPAKYYSFILSVLFCSLFSLIFVGIDIPFPSTIVLLLLLSNAIFAFFSILAQRAVIGLFDYNSYTDKQGIIFLFIKYVTLALFGLNYFVQLVLNRLPFLLNKLFALLFFGLLLIQWFIVIVIFNG